MRNKRNYHILIALALLQGFVFYAPVATLYRLEYGLTLSGLFLIESVSWVLTLVLEFPLGRFADRFGCRRTIVVGSALFFVSKLIFSAANGFALFLAERVVLSIALAALSGASESFLYTSVGPREPERRFGIWNAAGSAGVMAASLLAPMLYRISLRHAAYATSAAYLLAAGLSLLLEEPDGGACRGRRPQAANPGLALRSLFSDRPLILFLLALAAANECARGATVFLSQLQYKRAGVGEAGFGILFFLLQGAALSGAASGRLVSRFGRKRILVILIGVECACAAALAASASPWVTIPALTALSASAAVAVPVSNAVQAERVRHSERASALSLNAMVSELAAAVFNVVEGKISERSLPAGFWSMAVLLGLILAFSPRLLEAASEGKGRA